MINCDSGKEESSFVSETISTYMLSFIILDNISNLLLMKLMFNCPNTALFTLFAGTFKMKKTLKWKKL